MIAGLKLARQLLDLDGWSGPDVEPFSVVSAPGVSVNPLWRRPDDDRPAWLPSKTCHAIDPRPAEVVSSYSVIGALLAVGLGTEAFDQLELAARAPAGLQAWLRASDRRKADVLTLFTTAIERSKKAATKGERRG